MPDSIYRTSSLASVPPAVNEQQKQPNTFLTSIRKLVSDLTHACWPTQTHQPVVNPTEFTCEERPQNKPFILRELTRGQEVEAKILKQKNNWREVPNFKEAMIEHARKNPGITGKELDKFLSTLQTEYTIELASGSIDPVDLAININNVDPHDAIHSNNLTMIKWGIERYSNIIQSLIDEKDPVKISALLSQFEKVSQGDEKGALLSNFRNTDKLLKNTILNNPKLSHNQRDILQQLNFEGINNVILSMTLHPIFENKTDSDFLNAILKLSNALIPGHLGSVPTIIFKWADKQHNKEYMKALFENINSEIVFQYGHGNFREHFVRGSGITNFVTEVQNEMFPSDTRNLITSRIRPEELEDLLQKYDSGEQSIRSVDFLNYYILIRDPETTRIMVSRPEVPTVHILHARNQCLRHLEFGSNKQDQLKIIEVIDAELARRAGQ